MNSFGAFIIVNWHIVPQRRGLGAATETAVCDEPG